MLFCPQILHELHFAPIILWLYANYILYLVLTLQHSLCKSSRVAFFFSFYISERRGRATGLPDSFTGLHWNNARGRRMQDSYTTVLHHRPLTASPHLIYAPRPLLAWKIPWMEEPGRLQSMGSLGVRHDWATSLSLFTFMHCRRKWQPTPVFLPEESQGRGRPGGLLSTGSHRVGHDWSDLAAAADPSLWPGCGGAVLSALTYCVPLSAGWELKPPFYFLQTLFPYFLFGFGGQRKPRFWSTTGAHLP